jgi:mono/diheme cytochrome c family protein/cytochrome c2
MRTLISLLSLAVLAAFAGALAVQLGAYNVAATEPHLRPTFWLLDHGMRRSVWQRARNITPPPLGDPAQVDRGFALYQAHCVQCHGAPGVAPEPFALGLMPLPTSLVHTGRNWPAREVYWAVKHGIKMTGMPAWEFRMSEPDLWAVVAFVERLPLLTPADYAAFQAPDVEPPEPPLRFADADRGMIALHQYGCPACHDIPGVVATRTLVGPPLRGLSERSIIAGRLANTRANLVAWIRDPPRVNPGTAMPDLGVSEVDARDMAAYLYRSR